jgi:hypothetical protein
MSDPVKLRELASWYRGFAERAGNPVIWEGRLQMAEDLEEEAEHIEGNQRQTPSMRPRSKAARQHNGQQRTY